MCRVINEEVCIATKRTMHIPVEKEYCRVNGLERTKELGEECINVVTRFSYKQILDLLFIQNTNEK